MPSLLAEPDKGKPDRAAVSLSGDWNSGMLTFRESRHLVVPWRATGATIRFVSNDLNRAVLLADGGVGALPPFVAEEDVQAGKLVQVMPGRTLRARGGFFLLYPRSGQTSHKVTAFRDFLVNCLNVKPLA